MSKLVRRQTKFTDTVYQIVGQLVSIPKTTMKGAATNVLEVLPWPATAKTDIWNLR